MYCKQFFIRDILISSLILEVSDLLIQTASENLLGNRFMRNVSANFSNISLSQSTSESEFREHFFQIPLSKKQQLQNSKKQEQKPK